MNNLMYYMIFDIASVGLILERVAENCIIAPLYPIETMLELRIGHRHIGDMYWPVPFILDQWLAIGHIFLTGLVTSHEAF